MRSRLGRSRSFRNRLVSGGDVMTYLLRFRKMFPKLPFKKKK